MASGIFILLDDIATLMDDVAAVSKVATKKTAGILADDLAVNAEKASGFLSSRELPVLWKLTKGSFLNKLIILPLVFLLSAYLPQVIVPLLLLGGAYLSFEGALKIYEYFFKKEQHGNVENESKMAESAEEHEKKKIKSAILIDFILSVEIVIIAIGTVIDKPLSLQIPAVTVVAIIATIGVYGLVALLVRMDDFGYRLTANRTSGGLFNLGNFLIKSLPVIIRVLGVVGTIAMLLVGGGIFVHNIHFIHELANGIPILLADLLVGLIAGIILFALYKLITLLLKPKS